MIVHILYDDHNQWAMIVKRLNEENENMNMFYFCGLCS